MCGYNFSENALRELKALILYEQEEWASEMYTLLKIMNQSTEDETSLPLEKIEFLRRAYDKVVQRGFDYHESLAPPPSLKKSPRARKKRRTGHNLLLRFREPVRKFVFWSKPETNKT